MPTPDVGLAPPPPPDVQSQMKPAGGPAGGPLDLGSILASLGGGSPPALGPDITPKVQAVEPLLAQIARQVPALGPDVDRLNVELKSHMSGLPSALASLAGGPPQPASGTPAGFPPSPVPSGAAPVGPGASPAPGPPPFPAAPSSGAGMGALDTAMQLEMQLPAIGKDDPTLMPYIQGFIARMRDEVPKVVQGDTEAVNPPPQMAPNDSMLSKIPVTY